MAHALFAPSSAKRLMACPASFALHTDQGAGEDAAMGTVAHYIHERVLKGELRNAEAAIGETHVVLEKDKTFTFVVDVPMAEAVQESIDIVLDKLAALRRTDGGDPILLVEIRANISRWTPINDQFGTSDVVMISERSLVVDDYKHGSGVFVKAERNPQLALYALGVLDEYGPLFGFETVTMRVNQPRMSNFGEWTVTVDELLAFGAEIRERFFLCIEPDAPFGPSPEACTFCSAKATCPALAQRTEKLIAGAFDDLDVSDAQPFLPDFAEVREARSMTPEALSLVWQSRKLIEGYLEAVGKECEHRLLHGEEVPDLKLVDGRGSREWKDEVPARALLARECEQESDYLKVSLISPAQAEKVLPKPKRELLEPLIVKNKGKPTVAHVSDKRPAISPATEAFEDLDDNSGL